MAIFPYKSGAESRYFCCNSRTEKAFGWLFAVNLVPSNGSTISNFGLLKYLLFHL